MNCTWIVKLPNASSLDGTILLKFNRLDIEHQTICNYDYLTITNMDYKLSITLCGNKENYQPEANLSDPFCIKTEAKSLTLVFKSDASNQKNGICS